MQKYLSHFQFYGAAFINIAISIILLYQDSSILITSAIALSVQGLMLALSPFKLIRKSQQRKSFLEILALIAMSIQLFNYCFIHPYEVGYLLLKIYEMKLVNQLKTPKFLVILLLYNPTLIVLLIYQNSSASTYLMLLQVTFQIYLTEHSFQPKKLSPESPTSVYHMVSRGNEPIIRNWHQLLEQIPVGVMILNKNTLEPVFRNKALHTQFAHVKDLTRYLMDEIEFTIITKRRSFIKETSIRAKSQMNQTLQNPMKMTVKLMLNTASVPSTLNQILQELLSGQLDYHLKQDRCMELSAKIEKVVTAGIDGFDPEKHLKCKLYYHPDSSEIMLIIDDITIHTNFQKLEQRQNFQARLIDSFSHELRTPLNSAQLFLQGILREPDLSGDLKSNYLVPCLNSLKLQSYLIRDIIDFTQYHSNQISYNFEDFAFEDIIQEIENIFKPILKKKKLGLHVYVQNSINPIINSDYHKVLQILINCLQNSIKYSIKGLITIQVHEQDNYLQFIVRDQGCGIDGEVLQRIKRFLESFCMNREIAFQEEWHGLGLLTSQINLLKLAPQNKAQLIIESQGENQGCEVKFKIRLAHVSTTTLIMKSTKKRPSLFSLTSPDIGQGIQGLLIITNEQEEDSPLLKHIPILNRRRVIEYFRPYCKLPSDKFDNTTDAQLADTERSNLHQKLLKMSLSESPPNLIESLNQPNFIRRSSPKHTSYISDKHLIRQNTLFSRMQQKEELDIKLNQKLLQLQFSCDCNHVLTVDDEPFNQYAMQIILHQLGFQSKIAYNGIQAIEICRSKRRCSEKCAVFDFILMDCAMPILDGWHTTVKLRDMMKEKVIPNIPIIGVTAFNSADDKERCLQVGMEEVLSKPLQLSELEALLIKQFK